MIPRSSLRLPFALLALGATAGSLFAQAPKAKAAAPAAGSRAAMAALATPTDPATLQAAPGFKVELLYTVPKEEQGSWVSLAVDPKGRILAADQYGAIYRVTVPAVGTSEGTKVERLAATLPAVTKSPEADPTASTPKRAQSADGASPAFGAHGLLYAFDSLYVMVDEVPGKQGVWRLRDTKGTDQYDEVTFLRGMKGSGEHGPHSLVLSPDGKSIYFANGNHTDLPNHLEKSRAVRWDEDHLLPRMWDARGHAKNKFAPGGYVGRMDPDGKTVELFALGFRNHFDIAFDQNGELFTYDSDMEWDQGAPWYVPTRINHVVDAGDYGWRSGAGRWPAYYADSLPASLDIGPGCPTGTVFGTGAKFPAKYQRALFACDWTYGTLYAVHLNPDGGTFRGEKEEFLSGKPLPLTDLIIHPKDGAMYFTVGGRKTQAALYRVTYTGTDSTAPVKALAPTPEAKLRHTLEALHAEGTGPEAIAIAWPHLASPDRFVRFAARAAIERQLPENWANRALNEKNPQAAIEALIALARVGEKYYQPRVIESLLKLDFAQQPAALQLPLLRAWQLTFTRMGKPDAATCARLAAKFDPLFPHTDALVNRELLSLLIFLDSPTVVAKTVPLLSVSEPIVTTPEELGGAKLAARNDNYGKVVNDVSSGRSDRQQIAYAYALRNATVGWTPKLRTEFFSWFPRTTPWRGGASFTGFIQNIRTESLAHVTDPAEAAALNALSKPPAASFASGGYSPKGPGRNYTTAEATELAQGKLTGRDFAQGKALFSAAACIICHRFNNEGGGIGPDISGAGSRYSVKDLLENIVEPSKVISDQYESLQLDLANGSTVVGRIVGEENGELLVMSNPFMPEEKTKVKASDVKSRKVYPVSMMPPGLINGLNPEELKNLLAYVLSGGNAQDKMFAK
ncbi:MAG: c-type cytochrome [Verrucomicrobia bacterium]|nr:c-type cytochrome [Verrucomicrobiota bacterium]